MIAIAASSAHQIPLPDEMVHCIVTSPSYLDEHAKVRVGLTPARALENLPLFEEVEA